MPGITHMPLSLTHLVSRWVMSRVSVGRANKILYSCYSFPEFQAIPPSIIRPALCSGSRAPYLAENWALLWRSHKHYTLLGSTSHEERIGISSFYGVVMWVRDAGREIWLPSESCSLNTSSRTQIVYKMRLSIKIKYFKKLHCKYYCFPQYFVLFSRTDI